MTFPLRAGDFQLISAQPIGASGRDASARYETLASQGRVAAEVYVYQVAAPAAPGTSPAKAEAARSRLSQMEFETRKKEMLRFHPGAAVQREQNVTLSRGNRACSGRVAVFEFEDFFDGKRQAVISDLYLFTYVGGNWSIKYRFTRPKNFEGTKPIREFMDNLPWTLPSSPLCN